MAGILSDLWSYLKAVFWESNRWIFALFDIVGIVLFLVPRLAEKLAQNVHLIRSIGGGIFGCSFLIANFLVYRRLAHATELRAISAALVMLKDEIDQNLAELTGFWEKIEQGDESLEGSSLALAGRCVELGPPILICTVWEKQGSLLIGVLSNEQLKWVQSFYTKIVKITNICAKLQILFDEQQSYLKAGQLPKGVVWGVSGPPIPFQKNAPALWDDVEQIILRLLEEGNLLTGGTQPPAVQ